MDSSLNRTFKELGPLYKLLEINPTHDQAVIKEAFRKQILKHHPDKSKAKDANETFRKINEAYRILKKKKPELEAQFDKHKQREQYYTEKSTTQNMQRKKFAEDLLNREKASTMTHVNTEKSHKMTKEEQQREANKRMKREWDKEEEERKEELESRSAKKAQREESPVVVIRWPDNKRLAYDRDIIKILFSKYGKIKDVTMFLEERKALVEFEQRSSAEKACKENPQKEKGKLDNGFGVNLLSNENEDEKQSGESDEMPWNSDDIEKISKHFKRDNPV